MKSLIYLLLVSRRRAGHGTNDVWISGVGNAQRAHTEVLTASSSQLIVVPNEMMDTSLVILLIEICTLRNAVIINLKDTYRLHYRL